MPKKTWSNCEWFSELHTCPKSKEELMIQFRHNVSISESPPPGKLYDDSKGTEIDKRFCHNCDSFRANK